jgi:hypothetical protein
MGNQPEPNIGPPKPEDRAVYKEELKPLEDQIANLREKTDAALKQIDILREKIESITNAFQMQGDGNILLKRTLQIDSGIDITLIP